MNYQKIYDKIINRAHNRLIEGYTEKHHVIPKCMGGTDHPENLVLLTAEEHYIAHLLLVKIYPTNRSLWYAANMMANRNNKVYAWTRKKHAAIVSADRKGTKSSAETKKKISAATRGQNNPMYGRHHTEETKEKIRKACLNRLPELYEQIANSRRGKLHSEETKQLMKKIIANKREADPVGFSEAQRKRASNPKKKKDGYFKPKSAEHAKNISLAALQRPRVACEHCGKKITVANIKNHMKVHKNDSI